MDAAPASMAEVAAVAPMPVLEKLVDALATAPAKKKLPSSSNDKKRKEKGPPNTARAAEAPVAKRKGKGLPHPVPTSEVPIAKKPNTGDAPTSTAEFPRSSVAIAAGTHKAMQTLASAWLPAPRSMLPLLQDEDANGQTPQQKPIGRRIQRPYH
ncbi:uncharacterized protein LOC110430875 isoform X1 [Sorghum bicolor]|uniref:uncharacterized protein LOC110430875 isoform X1 n=1 Tax=Sorghum bicolor TaxID=4558 RepID=UPI000B423DEF|nr:uncharacterized protein LOC110430875 isoform X1 [Sorghum bicolor]|eukprot:XP_021304700.1 uncharacterized protein LOC110430875 isoform X1 [Sorghum bicolor]